MMRRKLAWCSLISPVLMALTACTGGSGGGGGDSGLAIPPHNVVFTYADSVGDASGNGGTAWDITGVQTTLVEGPFRNEYETLQVAVTFAQDVSTALPSARQTLSDHPELLGVGILMNIDGNTLTGGPGYICSSRPNAAGNEAYVDPGEYEGRLADGAFPILDANGIPKDEAQVAISGHTLTYTIDLAAWGSPSTGLPKTTIAVIAQNGANGGTQTDCAPNSTMFAVSGQ